MVRHVKRASCVLGIAMAVLLGACGGDDDGGPATCEELATIVGDCGGDTTEEEFSSAVCDLVVLSDDCLSEAGSAPCAEHVPYISTPASFANCNIAEPTPPDAPWINIRCPGRAFADRWSI